MSDLDPGVPSPPGILLSDAELIELTDYRQAAKQVEELRRQGFWRARRSPATGRVILERVHYEAVCAGDSARPRPQVKPPKIRPRAD